MSLPFGQYMKLTAFKREGSDKECEFVNDIQWSDIYMLTTICCGIYFFSQIIVKIRPFDLSEIKEFMHFFNLNSL